MPVARGIAHVCASVHTHTHMLAHARTQIQVCAQVRAASLAHERARTHMRVCAHAHARTHTRAHPTATTHCTPRGGHPVGDMCAHLHQAWQPAASCAPQARWRKLALALRMAAGAPGRANDRRSCQRPWPHDGGQPRCNAPPTTRCGAVSGCLPEVGPRDTTHGQHTRGGCARAGAPLAGMGMARPRINHLPLVWLSFCWGETCVWSSP